MTVPHEPPPAPSREARAARERIIDAAIRSVARDGTSESSMAVIAAEAGVSKALLHYHYSDRARLLAEVVTQLGERLTRRERTALDGADGSRAVDALWRWHADELSRGELRALLELSLVRDPLVQAALVPVMDARRRAASATVTEVLARLGLEPRIPAELLGETSIAFTDGLALAGRTTERDPRVAFDVFWLAMLGLAE